MVKNSFHVALIGSIAYVVLACLALFFYLERTAFLDISFHLFYIIKDGDFAFQNYRFGAFFTQAFPLIGTKLNLSLETIARLYSISFVVFYALTFAVCIWCLKLPRYGLFMLLLSTLMVTDTFYWIQSELPQGLAWMVLMFALFKYSEKLKQTFLIKALKSILVILVAFTHPILVIPVLFVLTYFFLIKHLQKKSIINLGIQFIGFYLIKSFIFKNSYDSMAMNGAKNLISFFPNYLEHQSNINFLKYLVNDYYFLGIGFLIGFYLIKSFIFKNSYDSMAMNGAKNGIFLIVCVILILRKEYKKLLLIGSFAIGYILLVNVSYPDGADQFYIENLYLPLSVFIIVPFVFDIANHFSSKLSFVVLIIVLFVRLLHIGLSHDIWADRIVELRDILDETQSNGVSKALVYEKNVSMDLLIMSWATPYEFWLLSTIETGETRSLLINSNLESYYWQIGERNKFITRWGAFNYDELPERYFHMKDSTAYALYIQ